MNNYRVYTRTDLDTYQLLDIEADSFREAINKTLEESSESQIVSIARFGAQDDMPLDDPFLAAILVQELIDCLDILANAGYDTSVLTGVLSGYSQQVESMAEH